MKLNITCREKQILFSRPSNSNTFSDWRRTCHVSWVKPWANKNSPTPLENNNLNFRLARDHVVHLETAANLFCHPASNKFFCSLLSMYNKTPRETVSFVSPRPGRLRVSGKQNSLFPYEPVIKCLLVIFGRQPLKRCSERTSLNLKTADF